MADYPRATISLTVLVIAAALFSGMFYSGRTSSRVVNKTKPTHAFVRLKGN